MPDFGSIKYNIKNEFTNSSYQILKDENNNTEGIIIDVVFVKKIYDI